MAERVAGDVSLDVVTVPTWGELRRRSPRLLLGIPVLGFGIAMTLQARLGVSPYDVLHQGLAEKTGLSFGTVVILVGLVILLFWIPLRQRPGLGTVVNTLTVGLVIDLALRVVPAPDLLAARIPLLVVGILVVGLGTVAFAFSIGPLGHFFLAHLHLESVPADLGPGAVGE